MKCIFCGKSAGFLKREHPECRALAETAKKYLRECIDYIYTNRDCMNIAEVISDTITRYHIPPKMADALFMECWNAKVMSAFEDGIIEPDEIKILKEMLGPLNIKPGKLSRSPQWKRLMNYGRHHVSVIIDEAISSRDLSNLNERISAIADLYGFGKEAVKPYALESWKRFLDKAFDDGVLDEDEENLLEELADIFDFTEADIGPYNVKMVKGAILREVMEGIVPKRLTITNQLPVLLQSGESVIWVYNDVPAYEDKIRRDYVGSSTGFSVRVARGVYLRSGAFRGRPVETTETIKIGSGSLIITNKNIFWISPRRSIKIPVRKLISATPCSNGVILQKDGATAKPLMLILEDPWFTCNLISNLNLLQ